MALLHVNFFSDVLGLSMNMDVILPQQTSGQIGMEGKAADGKCKTVYLLHGMSDDQTIWQRRTSIERYVSKLGLAVVMPTTHLGWYTDTRYGYKYWTFISEELPRICQGFFPQLSDRKEDRLAVGLSMGGYGAWKCGLGAPDTFGAAASLSGSLDIVGSYDRHMKNSNKQGKDLFKGIFGTHKQLEGSVNDLFALMQKQVDSGREKTRLYAWCGTEDFLYEGNLKAWAKAEELGFDLVHEEGPGDHQWRYWDVNVRRAICWWLGMDLDTDLE